MKKCPYTYCPLSENNNVFIGETLYMLVAALALINFPNTMTALSIILLLVPAILDMMFSKPKQPIIFTVIWLFLIVDGIVVLLCFLGLVSIIEYRNTEFYMPLSAVFLPGIRLVRKEVLAGVLISNIIPPFAYYIGNPCKKNMKHTSERQSSK